MALTHDEFLKLLDSRPNHKTDPNSAKAWSEKVAAAELEIRREVVARYAGTEDAPAAPIEDIAVTPVAPAPEIIRAPAKKKNP